VTTIFMLAAPSAAGFAVAAAAGAVFTEGFFDAAVSFALGHFAFSSPAQQLICSWLFLTSVCAGALAAGLSSARAGRKRRKARAGRK
jgi:hypothetical protein